MSVTILIPGSLRLFAGGESRIVLEGSPGTVEGALKLLWKSHPGLRDRIVTEQAQIRQHINVFVGNENIRDTNGLQTPLPEGGEITILPAISGG